MIQRLSLPFHRIPGRVPSQVHSSSLCRCDYAAETPMVLLIRNCLRHFHFITQIPVRIEIGFRTLLPLSTLPPNPDESMTDWAIRSKTVLFSNSLPPHSFEAHLADLTFIVRGHIHLLPVTALDMRQQTLCSKTPSPWSIETMLPSILAHQAKSI